MAKVSIDKYLTGFLASMSKAEYDEALREINTTITTGLSIYSELKKKVQSDPNKKFANSFNTIIPVNFSEESGGNLGLHNFWYIALSEIERGYDEEFGGGSGGQDGRGNNVWGKPNTPSVATQNYVKNTIWPKVKKILDIVDKYVNESNTGSHTIMSQYDVDAFFNTYASTGGDYNKYNWDDVDPAALLAGGTFLWQIIFETSSTELGVKAGSYIQALAKVKRFGVEGTLGSSRFHCIRWNFGWNNCISSGC